MWLLCWGVFVRPFDRLKRLPETLRSHHQIYVFRNEKTNAHHNLFAHCVCDVLLRFIISFDDCVCLRCATFSMQNIINIYQFIIISVENATYYWPNGRRFLCCSIATTHKMSACNLVNPSCKYATALNGRCKKIHRDDQKWNISCLVESDWKGPVI